MTKEENSNCCGGGKENMKEEIKVKGEQLVAKTKEILKEGNVRKISIKDKNGNVVLSIPLTIGVVGAVIAPFLAAVGAVAALLTECTITVEKKN
ncbi:MAG: DUF4342 domain-containing protein [bacterium]|nr:DUF4342 domain-containing protein [Candidatus Margulisiibacteriota bacterium]